MISFLRGIPELIEEDVVVLDVNGVGYEINVPTSLAAKTERKETTFYTYMYVREDKVELFGFDTRLSLKYFKYLINVSGIGPKGALSILSTLTIDELIFAVLSDDAKAISRANGIGNKTAVKAILELKDKIDVADSVSAMPDYGTGDLSVSVSADNDSAMQDAVMALVSLGYSNSQALRAVKACNITNDMQSDDILKLALKEIAKLGF